VAAGVQVWAGTDHTALQRTRAWAADAQMQGRMGGRPAGLYLTYAAAEGTPFPERGYIGNLFNRQPFAQWAAAAAVEFGIFPEQVTVGGGYRRGETGAATPIDDDNAFMVGTTLQLAQNVQVQLNHVWYRGNTWTERQDTRKMMVMLFAAF
jgi:hypothetical protein